MVGGKANRNHTTNFIQRHLNFNYAWTVASQNILDMLYGCINLLVKHDCAFWFLKLYHLGIIHRQFSAFLQEYREYARREGVKCDQILEKLTTLPHLTVQIFTTEVNHSTAQIIITENSVLVCTMNYQKAFEIFH